MKTTLKESFGFTALSLLLQCLLLGLLAGCTTHPPIAAELKPLQGYWEGEGAGGKCSITIKGNSLHYRVGENWYKTTFTLPAGTDPQQLHATIQDCSPPSTNAIGKVVFAIFKIEDGTLTLAEDDMSDKPPKDFPSASSRYNVKKVQPQKKNLETSTLSKTGQPQQTTRNAKALEPGRRHPAEIAKIVSGSDLVPTPIVFQNNTADIRKVYWLDYKGKRKLYRELKPWESYEIGTYLTHPWVVTDADGNALGLYFPDGQKRTVTLGGAMALVDPYFVETTNTVSKEGPRSITRNILQDKKGNIWLASWEGVIRYDGKSFFNETLINSLKKFHVFSLLEDSKGSIWIGTIRGGAYKYDGRKYTYYATTDGLIDNIIGCLAEDKDGNIWFGTDGGVSCFDGKRFKNYSMTDGLAGDSVNWIMQDKTGILWFATRTGVSRFDGKSFTNFKTAAGKDFDNARTVIEDRAGNVWIGGNDGLIRYRDGKLETLNSSFTGYLYEDKSGNVWTSSRSERGWSLSKYDGKTFELVIDQFGAGDFQGQVFGIHEDNVGNIWYGTVRGACMLEKGKDMHGTRLTLGIPR